MVLSVLYVALQRPLQLFFLRFWSTRSKDLEIVVVPTNNSVRNGKTLAMLPVLLARELRSGLDGHS